MNLLLLLTSVVMLLVSSSVKAKKSAVIPGTECHEESCHGGICKESCNLDVEEDGGVCTGGECRCCVSICPPCTGKCGNNNIGTCRKQNCIGHGVQIPGECDGCNCVCCSHLGSKEEQLPEVIQESCSGNCGFIERGKCRPRNCDNFGKQILGNCPGKNCVCCKPPGLHELKKKIFG